MTTLVNTVPIPDTYNKIVAEIRNSEQRRGILKWVFFVLVIGLGWSMFAGHFWGCYFLALLAVSFLTILDLVKGARVRLVYDKQVVAAFVSHKSAIAQAIALSHVAKAEEFQFGGQDSSKVGATARIRIGDRGPLSNAATVVLLTNNTEFCLLPDGVYTRQRGRFNMGLPYSEIEVEAKTVEVREVEPVPRDALVEDVGRLYQRQDGKPDRRYTNNPRVFHVTYGEISLTFAKSIVLRLRLSSPDSYQSIITSLIALKEGATAPPKVAASPASVVLRASGAVSFLLFFGMCQSSREHAKSAADLAEPSPIPATTMSSPQASASAKPAPRSTSPTVKAATSAKRW